MLLAALVIGVGHGLAFLDAQDELNSIAPQDRRAEVTAAFVCVVYVLVGSAVVGVGLLGEVVSLTRAVGAVGLVLAVAASCVAVWQLKAPARVLASGAMHAPGARATLDEPPAATTSARS